MLSSVRLVDWVRVRSATASSRPATRPVRPFCPWVRPRRKHTPFPGRKSNRLGVGISTDTPATRSERYRGGERTELELYQDSYFRELASRQAPYERSKIVSNRFWDSVNRTSPPRWSTREICVRRLFTVRWPTACNEFVRRTRVRNAIAKRDVTRSGTKWRPPA